MSKRMFWIGYGVSATLGGLVGAPHGLGLAIVGAALGGVAWTFGVLVLESR